MSDVWIRVLKPTDTSWKKVSKPNDLVTTTTTSIAHPKGRFMGILGLTYPGTSTTITTTTLVTWTKVSKPTS